MVLISVTSSIRRLACHWEKRLRNYGADAARSDQADQGSKEMDEKDHQVADRSMVARRGILRNYGRNNNSPETPSK